MILRFYALLKLAVADAYTSFFGFQGPLSGLKTETAIITRNVLSPALCELLVERIENTLTDPSNPEAVWADTIGSDQRIFGFEKHFPDVVKTLDVDKLVSAIERYTGRKQNRVSLMASKLSYKTGSLGSGGGMHRDSPFSHQVKVIWYLNDVSTLNGPFAYLEGSNKDLTGGVLELGETRLINSESDVIEKMTVVTGRAGDQIICDTRCIHGGLPPQSGERYSITLYTS